MGLAIFDSCQEISDSLEFNQEESFVLRELICGGP